MKNIIKMLGIIAIVAIIGLVVSCETDEKDQTTISDTDVEDQTTITITDFPDDATGYFGYIVLSKYEKPITDYYVAQGTVAKKINKGSFFNEMIEMKDYDENENLYIFISIDKDAATAQANALESNNVYILNYASYVFKSNGKLSVKKGKNTFSITKFNPSAKSYFDAIETAKNKTSITITGFWAMYEGNFGYIILTKVKAFETADIVAQSSAAKRIGGGTLSNEMLNMKGEIYGENEDLFIIIGIGVTAAEAQTNALIGGTYISDNKIAITKGGITIDMSEFTIVEN